MTISATIICICLLIMFLIVGIAYFFIMLGRFFNDHGASSVFESAIVVVLCVIAAVHMFKIGTEYNLVEKCEASIERYKFCEVEKTAVVKDADS